MHGKRLVISKCLVPHQGNVPTPIDREQLSAPRYLIDLHEQSSAVGFNGIEKGREKTFFVVKLFSCIYLVKKSNIKSAEKSPDWYEKQLAEESLRCCSTLFIV